MIYIHRDWTNVPNEVLEAINEAARALDAIEDIEQRKQFIRDNMDKWAAIRGHLSSMSFDKCWYSEARESVSRYQVDHFRPHGRAKQAERDLCDGYSWLAFDSQNYRLVGVLCNTLNQEHSEETVGKGDWFPLLDPTKRATLDARDCSNESPVLLDPVEPEDTPKLDFVEDGTVKPQDELGDDEKGYIEFAISCLGLDQDMLNRGRAIMWRECVRKVVKYNRFAKKPRGERTPEENETFRELASELIQMTKAESEFSAVSRCCLIANRLSSFIIRNELEPLAAPD